MSDTEPMACASAPSHPPGPADHTHRPLAYSWNGKLYDPFDALPTEAKNPHTLERQSETARPLFHYTYGQLCLQALKRLKPSAQLGLCVLEERGFACDVQITPPLSQKELTSLQEELDRLLAEKPKWRKEWLPYAKAEAKLTAQSEIFLLEYVAQNYSPSSLVPLFSIEGGVCSLALGPILPTETPIFGRIKSLSGAYWLGDPNRPMLQRLHGLSGYASEDLQRQADQEGALKLNDHRELGRRLGLFHFQEESPGNAFWHPNGFRILENLKSLIREHLDREGYQEVLTPLILSKQLWERSGHWSQFAKNMFITQSEGRALAIKPMSCPGHIQIFNQALHSYRELPLRLAEFGHCHRCEASGALRGLMRGIGFTQDDAHIFCTESQVESEVLHCIRLTERLYSALGFDAFEIKFSTRPELRLGDERLWDHAEGILQSVLEGLKVPFEVQEGEGAFYGPKLEFTLQDCMGRKWQCGTVQVDFSLPERLGAKYIDQDGQAKTPILLHRAVLGSLERFLGILLENTGGNLPLWISPVHCRVLTITDQHQPYAKEVQEFLQDAGLRVETDLRNEKIGLKIREAAQQKIPYLVICGDEEVARRSLAIRDRFGAQVQVSSSERFATVLSQTIRSRRLELPRTTDFQCE